jgi:hypothetical protein
MTNNHPHRGTKASTWYLSYNEQGVLGAAAESDSVAYHLCMLAVQVAHATDEIKEAARAVLNMPSIEAMRTLSGLVADLDSLDRARHLGPACNGYGSSRLASDPRKQAEARIDSAHMAYAVLTNAYAYDGAYGNHTTAQRRAELERKVARIVAGENAN